MVTGPKWSIPVGGKLRWEVMQSLAQRGQLSGFLGVTLTGVGDRGLMEVFGVFIFWGVLSHIR